MFLSILTADDKYSLQKQKIFFQFACAFLKSRLNFKHFQKKMTPIPDVYPKLRAP